MACIRIPTKMSSTLTLIELLPIKKRNLPVLHESVQDWMCFASALRPTIQVLLCQYELENAAFI